jgi:hypothetical protein
MFDRACDISKTVPLSTTHARCVIDLTGMRLGQGDLTVWPPHFRVNPLYFFLWGRKYAM